MQGALEFMQGAVGLGFGILGYLILAFSLWTMANKRKLDNPWFAWIPILNMITMVQLAGEEIWKIILFFIPCVNFVYIVYVWWKIAESQGKPGPLGILVIIPCLNLIVVPYIAFSD